MKKNTIISGPVGSGKSFIANCIASTHDNPLTITPKEFYHCHSLNSLMHNCQILVIEECTIDDILKIDNFVINVISDKNPPVIYVTREFVKRTIPSYNDFKIIDLFKPKVQSPVKYRYKLRAESFEDIYNFLCDYGSRLSKIIIKTEDLIQEPTLEFDTELLLGDIRMCLQNIEDSHVMYQTVQRIECYTGNRNYSL